MKTWRVNNPTIQNHLTVGLPKPLTYKPMVLYSLFRKNIDRQTWVRVSDQSYSEALAIRVFATRMAQAPLTMSIRPIKIESFKAEGSTPFARPRYNALKDSPLRERVRS